MPVDKSSQIVLDIAAHDFGALIQEDKMPTNNDRYVVMHPNGWAVKAGKSKNASSVHTKQKDAIAKARAIIKNNGSGELYVQNMKGQYRQKNTPAGKDPFPPRG